MVKEVIRNFVEQPKEFQGLATDTAAWCAVHLTYPNGTTYMEVDGAKRLFKLHEGAWYEQ